MKNEEKLEYIQNRLKAHYNYIENLGYEIVGIFLQGSQNYNLDIYDETYMSDVDTKCLVLPTLDNLIKGHPMTSIKYDFEGEQIDVKDIRVMMEMWLKQNQSYLEILFTKYKIINPKYKKYMTIILDMRYDIVKMNLPQLARCIRGMSGEKVIALKHVYPTTAQKIEKFGYDPKQLASIIRLAHLIENLFIKNINFDKAIVYDGELRQFMINIKKGELSLEEAENLANLYDIKTSSIKDSVIKRFGKDNFNEGISKQLYYIIHQLVKFGIISSVYEREDSHV